MNLIGENWCEGNGAPLESISPIDGQVVWKGCEVDENQVADAFRAADDALNAWNATSLEQRYDIIDRFARLAAEEQDRLGEIICRETGKPIGESVGEVAAVVAKCELTWNALHERRADQTIELGNRIGHMTHRALGVVSVFGPFNFPMHIANGQIVPALLSGNTVVFKPSELTPWSAEEMVKLWQRAGLPPGVLQLVQGGVAAGQAIVKQPALRGLFFTGSRATGIKLREALAGRLEVLLALELGGNNPLVVCEVDSVSDAVDAAIQSAFVTSGQRCTCVRRLIVSGSNEEFLEQFVKRTEAINPGNPLTGSDVMMGPLIHSDAVSEILAEQDRLIASGGAALVRSQKSSLGPAYVSPGIVDVTDCTDRTDDEVFGPLLQVIRVPDLESAIAEANRTQFGLSAGILCRRRSDYETFRNAVRAGLVNWNLPTTGASGRLPFGGLGHSGNYRPAGYHAVDFCSAAVAALEPSEGDSRK